ncbi:F-box domain containing protein, partial [Tanacetum coccineum]
MSSADVARSHGGDGGGDDRPPSHVTQNLSLKEIAVAKGPVSISFEQGDKQTLNPLGPHAAHWSNYIGEVVRSVPLYYPSWEKVPKERKAAIISEIGTLFDLRPHMDSSRWTEIYEGINMHLQNAYNTNKVSFKAKHWKADPTTGTYDVDAIRRARPEEITTAEWDKYIKFWNDPKNLARAAQNRLNRQKSVVISRQGSRSLARLRDEMRQASDTQEYPSLIDTFWRTHTVDGVFPKDEDRRIYEEMKRLEAIGEYTEDEINALARGGKLRGHIPGVGRVLPSRATSRPSMSAPVDKSLKSMHRKVDFMMSILRSDSKYSDMFKEFESGGASGSDRCGDDEESGDDEDDDGER